MYVLYSRVHFHCTLSASNRKGTIDKFIHVHLFLTARHRWYTHNSQLLGLALNIELCQWKAGRRNSSLFVQKRQPTSIAFLHFKTCNTETANPQITVLRSLGIQMYKWSSKYKFSTQIVKVNRTVTASRYYLNLHWKQIFSSNCRSKQVCCCLCYSQHRNRYRNNDHPADTIYDARSLKLLSYFSSPHSGKTYIITRTSIQMSAEKQTTSFFFFFKLAHILHVLEWIKQKVSL